MARSLRSIHDDEAIAILTKNFLCTNKSWFIVQNFNNIKSNFKFPVVCSAHRTVCKLFFLNLSNESNRVGTNQCKQWKTLNCLI